MNLPHRHRYTRTILGSVVIDHCECGARRITIDRPLTPRGTHHE